MQSLRYLGGVLAAERALALESKFPRPRQEPEETNSGAMLASRLSRGGFSSGGSLSRSGDYSKRQAKWQ